MANPSLQPAPGDSLWSLTRKLLKGFADGTFSSGGGGGGGGGAVTMAAGAVSAGAYSADSIGPGSISAGALSLGAFAADSIAAGAIGAAALATGAFSTGSISAGAAADGWDVTQGAKTDAAVTNPALSGSVIALLKGILTDLAAGIVVSQATAANLKAQVSGNVGGLTFTSKQLPTISTSVYVAGYTVGAIQTLTNAVTKSGGTGILESLTLLDKSNQKAAMDIFIFDVNPAAATTTDHAAFVFSTNDVNVIARVSVAASDYVTVNSEAIAVKSGLGIAVQASGSANLYAVAVTSGTPTYAATALQWVWGILQD